MTHHFHYNEKWVAQFPVDVELEMNETAWYVT